MKTTLTQAWEARGLGGMLLRTTVRGLLIKKFYSEDKRRAWLARGIALEYLTVVIFALTSSILFFYGTLPSVPSLDLSQTIDFVVFLVLVSGPIGMALLTLYVGQMLVRDIIALGYIDRYLFERRDEEVEL